MKVRAGTGEGEGTAGGVGGAGEGEAVCLSGSPESGPSTYIIFRGPGPGAGGSWSVRGARSGRWSSATLHTVANCIYYFALPTYANFPTQVTPRRGPRVPQTKKSGSAAPHRKLSTGAHSAKHNPCNGRCTIIKCVEVHLSKVARKLPEESSLSPLCGGRGPSTRPVRSDRSINADPCKVSLPRID